MTTTFDVRAVNAAYAAAMTDPAAAFARTFPGFGRPVVALTHDTFHVHESSRSRDCDGTYDHQSVHAMSKFGDRDDFWRQHLAWEISLSGEHQDISIDGHTATFFTTTDEGFRHTEMEGCDKTTCDLKRRRSRDHSAEAMGY